jgi:hypothetical protein
MNHRMSSSFPNRFALAAFIILFLATTAVRWSYIDNYAVAMPFWDQWDAEGAELIKPWIEGHLSLPVLWDAHNEHRILPTKLLTLFSYAVHGEWSNLHEARLSALVFAGVIGLVGWLILRERTSRFAALFPLSVLATSALLPAGWENFLVGFQSQFYFVMLFTTAGIAVAAIRPSSALAGALAVALAMASALTLASGLLTAVAVAFVYAVSYRLQKVDGYRATIAISALMTVAILALRTMPVVVGHADLRAAGIVELVDAYSHVMGWPVVGYHWAIFPFWLPTLVALIFTWQRRLISPVDVAMLGMAAWTAMQAFSIAYGRGHGLIEISSRYTDLLLLGLVANAWLAARIVAWTQGTRWVLPTGIVAFGYVCAFAGGHLSRYDSDKAAMVERHEQTLVQTRNVEAYLRDGEARHLDQPHFQIPYPNAARLKSLLDDPTIRQSLTKPGHAGSNAGHSGR